MRRCKRLTRDNIYVILVIMRSYNEFKKRILQNREVKKVYEELGPEYEIIALLIKRRLQRRLTQRELAYRIGTRQSAISRLESGAYNPSLNFLFRVADALDAELKVSVGSR